MPEAISSILVHTDEPFDWGISMVTHNSCGASFFLAETHDRNMGISGSLEDLRRFGASLVSAIDQYKDEVEHG